MNICEGFSAVQHNKRGGKKKRHVFNRQVSCFEQPFVSHKTTQYTHPLFPTLCIFFLFLSGVAFTQSLDYLSFDDPVYEQLEKAYAKGLIVYLPQTRPYTEEQAVRFLKEAVASLYTEGRKRDGQGADALLEELNASIERLKGKRYHSFSHFNDEGGGFLFDSGYRMTVDGAFNRIGDTVPTVSEIFQVGMVLGDAFYMDVLTETTVLYRPWTEEPYRRFYDAPLSPDWNMYTFFLTRDTKSFGSAHPPGEKDLTLRLNATNQVSFSAGTVLCSLGRDVLSWGPSSFANLQLSKTAKPYEYFSFSCPFAGKGSFIWMTGFLETKGASKSTPVESERKLVTAHRIEYQLFDWLALSVYESVVYSYRFELAYLNPLSVFAVSQVRLGDYDDVYGGADFLFRLPGTKLYLSLFADDWDFGHAFDVMYYHNELGGLLGAEVYDLFVPGFSVKTEYAYMSHWMYTHRDDIEGHAANNYTHFGHHLGHPAEPNSHMIQGEFSYQPQRSWKAGIFFWFMQDSWGDIYTPPTDEDGWDFTMDGFYPPRSSYNFLDYGIEGVVRESNLDVSLFGEYVLPFWGIKMKGDLAFAYTWNKDKVEGVNDWDLFFTLDVVFFGY